LNEKVEREAREEEKRLLNLLRELEENFVELQSNWRKNTRNLEYDDTLQHKDDVGKNIHELEKAKLTLEQQLEEKRGHIEELEDELQASEDAKVRLEVNMQASRLS
jgi:myosin heavy chain 9/10/11/14